MKPLLVLLLGALLSVGAAAQPQDEGRAYLTQLATDTWRRLSAQIEPDTCLPLDTLLWPSLASFAPQLALRATPTVFKGDTTDFQATPTLLALEDRGLLAPAVRFNFRPQPGGFGGLILGFGAVDLSPYSSLTLWARAEQPCQFQLKLKDASGLERLVVLNVGPYVAKLEVPISEFGVELSQITAVVLGFDAALGPADLTVGELAFRCEGRPTGDLPLEPYTSASNLGLLCADVIAARDLGLLPPDQAQALIARATEQLLAMPKWRGGEDWGQGPQGFIRTWFSPLNQVASPFDPWVCSLDLAHLHAGLVTAQAALEGASAEADLSALVAGMDWRLFLDPATKRIRGGYREPDGLSETWFNDLAGSDGRLSVAMAIASGAADGGYWDSLNRETETRYGQTYLLPGFWQSDSGPPGWKSGGLFMQYLDGLWLTENPDGLLRRSARACALAQQRHSEALGAPVWGWSCCVEPGSNRYVTGDERWPISDAVATPHASALAVADFPTEVIANLRALEALGARPDELGFADAVNWRTGEVTDRSLFLDQSMLFLSIADYLLEGKLRGYFDGSPFGQRLAAEVSD
jgi:hypothetical protein